jgi:two-component system, sensor histidine kinase and response regulator
MLRKFWTDISYAGIHAADGSFDGRRQIIFNQLNFLAIASCIIRLAFMGVTMSRSFSALSFLSSILPIFICIAISIFNATNRYDYAKIAAFFLLPPAITFIALQQNDYGLSMFPLIFCILGFFFLEQKRSITSAYICSGICFVILRFSELLHNDRVLFFSDLPLIIFNHILVLGLVFLLLNFIYQVVESYQRKLAVRNDELATKNSGLMTQQKEIVNKTKLLEERQRMLEDSNRQKNKMLSVISHDLRTPVQSVKNLLDLHAKGIISDEKVVQYTPEINREMCNVIDLLENLLSWSRQQQDSSAVKKEKIQLRPLVNEIIGLYHFTAQGKNVTVYTDVPEPVTVTADRQMIKTVLRNLVSNAVKFSKPGGSVKINAATVQHQVHISIIDEGTGISPEHLSRINKGEEVTTKGTGGEYGSGLGLNLCREFIQKNKGALNIHSIPGKGSNFSFSLPVNEVTDPVTETVTAEVLKPVLILRPVRANKAG